MLALRLFHNNLLQNQNYQLNKKLNYFLTCCDFFEQFRIEKQKNKQMKTMFIFALSNLLIKNKINSFISPKPNRIQCKNQYYICVNFK